MWKKLDAWLYGIEQRIAKWKRSRTPEYRTGRKARRDGIPLHRNPHGKYSVLYDLWLEGWMDEENRA